MSKIRIAHEAPTSILKEISNITDYDYALVHLFDTKPEYYDHFKKCVAAGRDVLLDNSIFELGTAFDAEKFAVRVEELQPTFYVVPDVLEDAHATIESFRKFDNGGDLPGMKIGVVQGKDFSEIVECYKYMQSYADMIAFSFDMSYFQYTGIGYCKLHRQLTGRIKLIDDLIKLGVWNWSKPVHLLGCSLMREFNQYSHVKNIYSCDTSNPVVAGIEGIYYRSRSSLS